MNQYENLLLTQLVNFQAVPDEELRSRILADAERGTVTMRAPRRRLGLRAAVIAAVIVALTFTTAIAYGDVLKEFMFGASIARQRERVYPENIYTNRVYITYDTEFKDMSIFEPKEQLVWTYYGTQEKAEQFFSLFPSGSFEAEIYPFTDVSFPFEIKRPTYLPECVTGLRETYGISMRGKRSGAATYTIAEVYNIAIPNEGNLFFADGTLRLDQTYYGTEIKLEIETASDIEKVMVGDCEALLITLETINPIPGRTNAVYNLVWVKDNIYYRLESQIYTNLTRDDFIAIAESV